MAKSVKWQNGIAFDLTDQYIYQNYHSSSNEKQSVGQIDLQ